MPMRAPAAGLEINLHIAGQRRAFTDLHHRAAKVRAALHAQETGMQDAHRPAIRSFQPVALKPLLPPDGLQQFFGRQRSVIMQQTRRLSTQTPDRIKILSPGNSRRSFLPVTRSKVKADDASAVSAENVLRFHVL